MESLFAPNYWRLNVHSQTGSQPPHPCQGHTESWMPEGLQLVALLKTWASLIGITAFALMSGCSSAVGTPWCSLLYCWAWLFNNVLIGFENSSRGGEQERKELLHIFFYVYSCFRENFKRRTTDTEYYSCSIILHVEFCMWRTFWLQSKAMEVNAGFPHWREVKYSLVEANVIVAWACME